MCLGFCHARRKYDRSCRPAVWSHYFPGSNDVTICTDRPCCRLRRCQRSCLRADDRAASDRSGAPRQPALPLFTTTKVEGTDNVYIFRYQGHQSMFVVTPAGVIATDPIGLLPAAGGDRPISTRSRRSRGADQVRDLQPPPLRSRGRRQAVQGRSARRSSRTRTLRSTSRRRNTRTSSSPTRSSTTSARITLGGTTLELLYVGRNHSDNSLVMRLPKERIIFTVDFIPLQGLQFRNMPDTDFANRAGGVDQARDRPRLGAA